MDELAYFMDWDLEAVVRGCSSIEAAPTTNAMEDPFLDDYFSHNNNFNFFSEDDEMFFSSFPEFSESTRVLDELEELYKPFYPVLHNSTTSATTTTTTLSPHHHQAMVTNPQAIIPKEEDVKVKPPSQKAAPQHLQQLPSVSKSKRSKKNQNKRVVKEVTAGEIGACDAWAWRKYGQKPIKGSPYPRSYYRCSSSKGCLARKQVERSHLDPALFFVTYTSDHNHPHPTRRNSLAGSTRKSNSISILAPPPPTTITANYNNSCSTSNSSNSAFSALSLSPRTPLLVQSMEDNNTNNNDATVTTSSSSSNIIINNTNNNNKGLKKQEEEDFVELLDGADDDWFPNTQNIDDEMMGLDYRQLEIEIDGGHFMEHHFAAT